MPTPPFALVLGVGLIVAAAAYFGFVARETADASV